MTNETFLDRTEYLPGVPCLIDTEQPDPEAAAEFYGGIFGWEFDNKLPPGIDGKYLVASLHGFDVAAIASPTPGVAGPPTWNTYVSVVDADATTAQAVALGAEVLVAPIDVGPPGSDRWSVGRPHRPRRAHIRLWQPGYRHGAQLVNSPGTWNSSDLATNNVDGATAFYGAIFGWQADPVDFGGGDSDGDSFMWRLPGYGNFLAIRRSRHQTPSCRSLGSRRVQRRDRLDDRRHRYLRRVAAIADAAVERDVLGERHGRRRRTGGPGRRHRGLAAHRSWRWGCPGGDPGGPAGR